MADLCQNDSRVLCYVFEFFLKKLGYTQKRCFLALCNFFENFFKSQKCSVCSIDILIEEKAVLNPGENIFGTVGFFRNFKTTAYSNVEKMQTLSVTVSSHQVS